MYRLTIAIILCCVLAPVGVLANETFFREQVAPLLIERCLSCHNPERTEGGLSLATAESTFAGGESGEAITRGDAAESYLVERILPVDGKAEMPEGQPPLTDEQIALIERWIDQGADWPKDLVLELPVWWSFAPLAKPTLPAVKDHQWARNPVDRFILDGLTKKDLHPSAEADRRTLIRRLSYDLLGLPPSPEEVDQFVNDSDPEAYEQLVDRMLASPRYGERWGRHWLDVVHYGETHGYEKDKMRLHAWP